MFDTKSKHVSGLLKKQYTYQLRQKRTNIGTVFYVISLLFIVGMINNIPEHQDQYDSNSSSPWKPIIQNYTYPTTTFEDYYSCSWSYYGTCADWYYGWFSDSKPDSVGTLAQYTKSGMLGNVKQFKYTDDNITVPYLDQYNEPNAYNIDQLISNKMAQLIQQADEIQKLYPNNYYQNSTFEAISLQIPDAVFNFLEYSKDKKYVEYILQVPFEMYSAGLNNFYNDFFSDVNDNVIQSVTMITNAFLRDVSNSSNITIVASNMPYLWWSNYNGYGNNFTPKTLAIMLGIYFVPGLIMIWMPLQLYSLVWEKHEKLVEMMKMMGMRMKEYWLSTFIFSFLTYFFCVCFCIAVLACLGFDPILQNNPLTYLILFLLYGISQSILTMFFSIFFWRPIPAIVCGISIYIICVGGIPNIYMFWFLYKNMGNFLMIFPPFAFIRGWYLISYATAEIGYEGTSPTGPLIELDSYSPLVEVYVYLIVVSFCLFFVTLYLEQILPREHGVANSPFFPFIWLMKKMKTTKNEELPLLHEKRRSKFGNIDDVTTTVADEDCQIEKNRAKQDLTAMVRIVELTKKYRGADKYALAGFSLAIKEGECVGLLGPNGAGKTTLISMLCGMTEPTSGDAIINKNSILTNMQNVHEQLGYCPQHSILWPELTVEEHLLFYCALKNHGGDVAYLHVQRLAQEVGLSGEHLHKRVVQLSGGLRRRLSIAIALVGSSRVVLLDEPTTGLDHNSREAIWDIIERQKQKGRCFVITTHDLGEADVLCSRIVIVSQGKMVRIGSPAQLKAKVGSGFTLSITISKDFKKKNFRSQFDHPSVNYIATTNGILEFAVEGNTDLTSIFDLLYKLKEQCGVIEWSISPTSLEQVFIKIIHNDEGFM